MVRNSPKSLEQVSELHSYHPDILRVAEYGYAVLGQVLNRDPGKIHFKRWCRGVKIALGAGLIYAGYDPESVIRTRGLLQVRQYLGLESSRGLILVDGTWQQYLPRQKRSAHLPPVAVGTANELVDLAANSGVKEANLAYWADPKPAAVQYEERIKVNEAPDLRAKIDDLLLYSRPG